MPDIKQDLLSLQYSQNFTIDGLQEANVDLSLPPAGAAAATVYGVVTDGTAPIADATVKLFDSPGPTDMSSPTPPVPTLSPIFPPALTAWGR